MDRIGNRYQGALSVLTVEQAEYSATGSLAENALDSVARRNPFRPATAACRKQVAQWCAAPRIPQSAQIPIFPVGRGDQTATKVMDVSAAYATSIGGISDMTGARTRNVPLAEAREMHWAPDSLLTRSAR